MLVLSRKKEETIQVGHDITITILRIKGHSVQIGIEAPTGVTILRSELLPRVAGQHNNETETDASQTSVSTPTGDASDDPAAPSSGADSDPLCVQAPLIAAGQARRRAPRQSFTTLESQHHGVGPASLRAGVTSLGRSGIRPKATA